MNSLWVSPSDYEKVFLGRCHGIGLKRRGTEDPHVEVEVLVEDDESWFINSIPFSSFWLKDLQDVLAEADTWIKQNCDPDIRKGVQWGWKFR